MAIGKYSPIYPHSNKSGEDIFKFNCYGEVPAEWNQAVADSGVEYDQKTMFGGYDDEGFDMYGYSAFDKTGKYVGIGEGIDRAGYTELDYLTDSVEDGNLYSYLCFQHKG